MATKKTLGEKIALLAKASGKSQTDLAEEVGMTTSQLNRFLRGHSDLMSTNLAAVLSGLGIDLDELIAKRIRRSASIEDETIETPTDAVVYLYRSLDDIGRQTYLNSLAWAAKTSRKQKLPASVASILKQELSDI